MKKSLFLMLTFCMLGCATAYKINSIGLGMSKEEVIKKMGKPASASAIEGTEYLN